MIGFEETFYRVAESAGLVRVGVAVLEGAGVFSSGVMERVQLRLNTQSGSALGKFSSFSTHTNKTYPHFLASYSRTHISFDAHFFSLAVILTTVYLTVQAQQIMNRPHKIFSSVQQS